MDSELKKEVLRRTRTFLRDNLYETAPFIDDLLGSRDFTTEDKQNIECQHTEIDKFRKLLDIVIAKADSLYDIFLNSLSTGGSAYCIPRLREEEITVVLEQYIKTNFCEGEGTVDLEGIYCILPDVTKCATDEHIIRVIRQVYCQVELNEKTKQLENITKKPPSEANEETMSMISEETGLLTKPVINWSKEDVGIWLKEIDMDKTVVSEFLEEGFNGESLLELKKEKEVLKEFGSLKRGKRLILLKRLNSLECKSDSLQTKDQVNGETLPEVFSISKESESRKENSLYNLSNYNSHTNSEMIEPILYYANIDVTTTEGKSKFKNTLIKFVSSCLNYRRDGKLVNGIESNRTIKGTHKLDADQSGILQKGFPELFETTIRHCVSPTTFIKVEGTDHYLSEIFVTANHSICKNNIFRGKTFKANGKKKKQALYKYTGVDFHALASEEDEELKTQIKQICARRKQQEDALPNNKKPGKEHESMSAVSTCDVHEITTKKPGDRPIEPADEDISCCDDQVSDIVEESREVGSSARKLKELLCFGDEMIASDVYPILVTNSPPLEMSREDADKEMQFIAKVPWNAVFDFSGDNKLLLNTYEKHSNLYARIKTIQEFNEKTQDPDDIKNIEDEIEECLKMHFTDSYGGPHWIFSNGYCDDNKQPKLDSKSWNKYHCYALTSALRLYEKLIPNGRALVVFLGISNDTDVWNEAMKEIIKTFDNQWIFLSNDETTTTDVKRFLSSSFEAEHINQRSVCNIQWEDVKCIFEKMYSHKNQTMCILPTVDDGQYVQLDPTHRSKMPDLEILSSNECDQYNSNKDKDLIFQQEEMKYYNGAEVSWLNFQGKNHVCERDIEYNLMKEVRNTLKPTIINNSFIGRVWLYHQPGAGATTLAKKILWNFRKEYRCAVIRQIGDQTHVMKQILDLRSYKESNNPKPVLILLDNPEEDSSTLLVADMEEQAKQIVRSQPDENIICTFLICLRKSKVPDTRRMANSSQTFRCSLGHNLSLNERKWWTEKSEALEQRNTKDSNREKINPSLLISFNIMKSNFNKDFIKRMVTELLAKIENEDEKRLLKYVALLNAFDLSFRSIPSSTFDQMMFTLVFERLTSKEKKQQRGKSDNVIFFHSSGPSGVFSNRSSQIRSWISKLSTEFRVLMNDPAPFTKRSITNLRITNALLSLEILNVFQEKENQTISEMALEFLDNKDIFKGRGIDRSKIQQTVVDILKRRERTASGLPEANFSPMIQHIMQHEDVSNACMVLEKVFHVSNNPFICQHIARLNIFSRNWDYAIKFAKKGTELLPESSILWDTCGRIYKKQLAEENRILSKENDDQTQKFPILVDLASSAAENFHKAQACAEKERTTFENGAVYLGELETVQLLFFCLEKLPMLRDRKFLNRVLVDESFFPAELDDINGKTLQSLRDIVKDIDSAIAILEDDKIQLRDIMYVDENRNQLERLNRERLEDVKVNLDYYLYLKEDQTKLLSDATPEKRCKINRREIRGLCGNSSYSICRLVTEEGGEVALNKIRSLCEENISTEKGSPQDYQTAIQVSLALVQYDDKYAYDIKYSDVAMWSKILYKRRETMNVMRSRSISLEPYMFYVMFNWPRGNNMASGITVNELESAIEQWNEAYYNKHPRQKNENSNRKYVRKEGTTMYFFKNGSDMNSIVNSKDLKSAMGESAKGDKFWNEPVVLRSLQRFEGRLLPNSAAVSITLTYATGNKQDIEIPTSIPIKQNVKEKTLVNRKVFFAIGFTWLGPRAFDVREKDPGNDPDASTWMALDHNVFPKAKDLKKRNKPVFKDLENKLAHVDNNLKAFQKTFRDGRKIPLNRDQDQQRRYWQGERERIMDDMHKMMKRLEEF